MILHGLGRALGPSTKATTATAESDNSAPPSVHSWWYARSHAHSSNTHGVVAAWWHGGHHHHHHHHRRLGPAGVRDTPWTGPGPRSFRKSDKQRLPRITYVLLCGLGRALGPSAKATTATAESDNSNSLTHSLTLSLTHSLCCCCCCCCCRQLTLSKRRYAKLMSSIHLRNASAKSSSSKTC